MNSRGDDLLIKSILLTSVIFLSLIFSFGGVSALPVDCSTAPPGTYCGQCIQSGCHIDPFWETLDYWIDGTKTCQGGVCSSSTCVYLSVCSDHDLFDGAPEIPDYISVSGCTASCDQDTDCDESEDIGGICYYNGYCNGPNSCQCAYESSQQCLPDGWYCNDNGNSEYRNYFCSATGCDYEVTDTNVCNDENVCNGIETCSAGYCVQGTPLVCDNGLWCDGQETCNPISGCQDEADPNCDDKVGCTEDSCDEGEDNCDNIPNDALCDNELWCDGEEYCNAQLDCQDGTSIDCSGNNLNPFKVCNYNPDNNPVTLDEFLGFTSECNEDTNSCTVYHQWDFLTHTCSQECRAECDENGDCQDKCVGEILYTEGDCDLEGLQTCTCSYNTENCDLQDGWYNTGNTQWIESEECTEKEQRQQEYREYFCDDNDPGCDYYISNTQWVDTGNTRDKPDKTPPVTRKDYGNPFVYSNCEVYDDFSSGNLDTTRWEIKQDVEGQPFMDEYWVDSALKNFHTQQNNIGDRRVYLVPKHTFTTGDIFEYDFNVISKEGNYMQMDLLTEDQYIRIGIMGYIDGIQGYDELGISHIKIEFQENNLHLIKTSPSGLVLTDNLFLTNPNGNYKIYIGSVSGHNGKTHIDYDNFELCTQQEDSLHYINSLTPITLSAVDPQGGEGECPSGIDKIKYRTCLDAGCYGRGLSCSCGVGVPWQEYIGSQVIFNIPEDSEHCIEFYSEDIAGNPEEIQSQCVFVDNQAPEPIKTVGEVKTKWMPAESDSDYEISYFYPEETAHCWEDSEEGIECWKVTLDTPIDMECNDDPQPHPVGFKEMCFKVDWDGEDVTQNREYCSSVQGSINKEGYCCVREDILDFTFKEESEHNLEYYCEDILGNRKYDDEKFKVFGKMEEISLEKKWNLISVPFDPIDKNPEAVFSEAEDSIYAVWSYDAEQNKWFVYRPGEDLTNNLEEIETGFGYWVMASNSAAFNIGGSLLAPGPIMPPSQKIVKGWNLIGYYGTDPADKPVYCALFSLVDTQEGFPRWSSLWGYDALSQSFFPLAFLDNMNTKQGYWIETDVEDYYVPSTECFTDEDSLFIV